MSEICSSLSCSEDNSIASNLADLINGKFNAEYSVEKRKEILQKYKKPSNCDHVLVPKVNEEIWSKLPTNAKRSDIRTSALQDTLVKVSSAIICTTDKLLEHRKEDYSQLQSIDKSLVGFSGLGRSCLYGAILQKKGCLETLFVSGFPSSMR